MLGDRATARLQVWLQVGAQVALLGLLFLLWRVVGRLALVHTQGAIGRAEWIDHAERALHLPSELAVQHAFLGHEAVLRAADAYYAYVHAPALAVALLWLLLRHRDRYARWCTVTVVFTAAALVVELLPVAPPRLLPAYGFVDTARRDGLSVYGATTHGFADQLSSMPSIHVGWALLVAAIVVAAGRSRWRWLVVLHPVVTVFVVTVTANHWWFDDLAAAALLALVVAACPGGLRRARSARG
ncbi:MAG TPA: phosphatase PAP2 family protein [Mycobacteriales bacterium]